MSKTISFVAVSFLAFLLAAGQEIGTNDYARGPVSGGGAAAEMGRNIWTNALPLTNSYTDLYRRTFGEEYLLPWQNFVVTNRTSVPAQVFILGDSTIFGASTATGNIPDALRCDVLLSNYAQADAVPNIQFINMGSNSVSSAYFSDVAAAQATNLATPDGGTSFLAILGYGANDSYFCPNPDYGAFASYTNTMAGIALIRQALPNASFLWKMPNAMSFDAQQKCEAAWEYYKPWYALGSRQASAAFYDTYALYSDARSPRATNWVYSATGSWPDGVHPGLLNWLVWRGIYDMILPRSITYNMAQNSDATFKGPHGVSIEQSLTVGGTVFTTSADVSNTLWSEDAAYFNFVELTNIPVFLSTTNCAPPVITKQKWFRISDGTDTYEVLGVAGP